MAVIRRIRQLGLIAALTLALPGGGFAGPPPDSFAVISPQSKKAAEFGLKDMAGKTHSPGDYRGKVLLIHFWASWCRPCEKEMPSLMRLDELLRERGLVVLAVAVDSPKRIKPKVERWGPGFPVLIDRYGGAMNSYGIKSIPSSVVVGRDGTVKGVILGERDYSGEEALSYFEGLLGDVSGVRPPETPPPAP